MFGMGVGFVFVVVWCFYGEGYVGFGVGDFVIGFFE